VLGKQKQGDTTIASGEDGEREERDIGGESKKILAPDGCMGVKSKRKGDRSGAAMPFKGALSNWNKRPGDEA